MILLILSISNDTAIITFQHSDLVNCEASEWKCLALTIETFYESFDSGPSLLHFRECGRYSCHVSINLCKDFA